MASIDIRFSTRIYRARLSGANAVRLNEDLKRSSLSIAEDDEAGQRWCAENHYNGYTSYASLDDLPWRFPDFADLAKHLDKHVAAFAKELDFDLGAKKLVLDDLWINILPPGGVHTSHIHPHSAISGTYYVSIPEGASAIKFRLGARMHYDDASTKRDHALIKLTRKTFGDNFTIYADGNGSYDVPMAIRIGRMMEEYKLGFFEEPVPFDHYEETKQIADTLTIPIALGEEEMSLRQFRYIIERDVAQVIQPDLMYFGGFVRSLKVARMAAVAGKDCTLHMSGGGLGYLYVAHFASIVKNCGAHQEDKGEDDTLPVSCDSSSLKSEKGRLKVPTGPGLGITIDPSFVAKASVVTA